MTTESIHAPDPHPSVWVAYIQRPDGVATYFGLDTGSCLAQILDSNSGSFPPFPITWARYDVASVTKDETQKTPEGPQNAK